jgi:hypothetical protein
MVVEIRYGYRDLSDEKSNVHAGSLNLCAFASVVAIGASVPRDILLSTHFSTMSVRVANTLAACHHDEKL